MKHVTVDIYSVPGHYWTGTTKVSERSLENLAQDARGLERRMAKGINPAQSKLLYYQVTGRIEQVCMNPLVGSSWPHLVVEGSYADALMRLLDSATGSPKEETLQEIPQESWFRWLTRGIVYLFGWWLRRGKKSNDKIVVPKGRTFFSLPGELRYLRGLLSPGGAVRETLVAELGSEQEVATWLRRCQGIVQDAAKQGGAIVLCLSFAANLAEERRAEA